MSKDISVRVGETFQLPVTIDDDSAETVEFNVWAEGGEIVLSGEETFVNGEATIDTGIIDLDVADYHYGLIITYSDGVVDTLPDTSECEDNECDFPIFQVCEGIPEGS